MASGKAFLKFSHPSLTDYLIITWAEFDTPLAEIGRQAYAAPHPERSLTVTDIRPVMHRFTWWTSTDGVTLNTPILTMDIDCGTVTSVRAVYEYKVDRGLSGADPAWADPVSGTTDLPNDARWAGAEAVEVERRGFGTLLADECTPDLVNGSFSLLAWEFETDDVYFVKVNTIVDNLGSSTPSSTSGDLYIDSVSFAADAAYDVVTHGRKEVVVTTSANMAIMSFATLSTLSKTKVLITTHGMTGRYLKLALSAGDTVTHPVLGIPVSELYLRRGMEVELVVGGGEMRVLRYEGDGRRMGEMVWGRGMTKDINRVTLDGTEYSFSALPGLYYEYVSNLPADQVKDYTTWGQSSTINGITEYPNKGFFAVDAINQKFKVPDLRDRVFKSLKLSGTDSTRITDKAGGLQMDSAGPLNLQIRDGYGGSSTGSIANTGFSGQDHPYNWIDNGTPGSEKYIRNKDGSTQTLVRNIGFIPQIII